MSDEAAARDVVFVSYSREDGDWRRRFELMLAPLVDQHRIELWSDDRILTGYEWRPQLEEAIGRSTLALVLVSPDSLASGFIMREELPALERAGARLVPVLVRPCLWKHSPLKDIQWAHDPGRDGPIAGAADQEGEIVRICERLVDFLPEPVTAAASQGLASRPPRERRQALERGGELGALHDLPPLPLGFVERDEIAALREALFEAGEGALGLTGDVRALGLHGQGGIGKTVLATALARDHEVRSRFPDGIFWVTLGEDADVVGSQLDLLRRLDAGHPELRFASRGLQLLRDALSERRCLLVVDDVWSMAAAEAFRATGPHGRVLYTTRDPSLLAGVGADVAKVDVLPVAAARQLLAALTNTTVEELPSEADIALEATGRVALGLALLGAAIGRGGQSWSDIVTALERGAGTFLEHPYANTFKALKVAVAALPPALADAYEALAVYPHDTSVVIAAVERYWQDVAPDGEGLDTRARLRELADRELLTFDGDAMSFHDLQRDFLLLRTADMRVRQSDLLNAYRRLLPAPGRWRALPADEPYIWDHLLYHLREAGDAVSIRDTVADLGYLARRIFRGGPYAAEADLRIAEALFPEDECVQWLLGLVNRRGYLLAGHETIGDLAATLLARIQAAPTGVDATGVHELLPHRYLEHVWGLPQIEPGLDRVLEGHVATVTSVAFAPDGRTIATGSRDHTVRLWSPRTGRCFATLDAFEAQVNEVHFAPDGSRLAGCSDDGTARIWDGGGRLVAVLSGDAGTVDTLTFSADGDVVITGHEQHVVITWDAATGELRNRRKLDGLSRARRLATSPDGLWMVRADFSYDAYLEDLTTGEQRALQGHAGFPHCVAFSPDGRWLATAGTEDVVRVWDLRDVSVAARTLSHANWVYGLAFSPDGHLLASGDLDGTVWLWDVSTGEALREFRDHSSSVNDVAFAPDGARIASASSDSTIRLWDPARGDGQAPRARTVIVFAVAAPPDSPLLFSSEQDAVVERDARSGTELRRIETGHHVYELALSPDGRLLAGAKSNGTATVWDAGSLATVTELNAGPPYVSDVAFSPDGRLLATSGVTIKIWDHARGACLGTSEEFRGTLIGLNDLDVLCFSPDGRRVLAARGGELVVCEVPTAQTVATLATPHEEINALVLSPDGTRLITCGRGAPPHLWDVDDITPIGTLSADSGTVSCLAFSPDGRRLICAGHDRRLTLRDGTTGERITSFQLGEYVADIAWAAHGITVAASRRLVQLRVAQR